MARETQFVAQDYFPKEQTDPLAPVRLEVIDRATDEALNRLIELGLLSRSTRATRPLFPGDMAGVQTPQLSEAEKAQAAAHRQQAARKIKMASLLGEGGLLEEGRSALLDGALALGRALAVESRMPEPASMNEALIAPLSQRWGDALIPLREFLGDAAGDWKPIVERLQKI